MRLAGLEEEKVATLRKNKSNYNKEASLKNSTSSNFLGSGDHKSTHGSTSTLATLTKKLTP